MGNRSSFIISLNDARKRCDADTWERFNKGFDKICDKHRRLDKHTFQEIFRGVPKELVMGIFHVFDIHQRGHITQQEFLCGMTVLCHGTQDERLKFLFNIYNISGDGIKLDHLKAFWKGKNINWKEAFPLDEDDAMSYREFHKWAKNHMTPGLVTWIFDIANVRDLDAEESASTAPVDEPLKLGHTGDGDSIWVSRHRRADSVAQVTQFNDKEVSDLERYYDEMLAVSPVVDVNTLAGLFSPDLPPDLVRRILHAFDLNGDGSIDAREFLVGLSSCVRGTVQEKMKFCFRAFDTKRQNKLSRNELLLLVESIWRIGDVKAALEAETHETSASPVPTPRGAVRSPSSRSSTHQSNHASALSKIAEATPNGSGSGGVAGIGSGAKSSSSGLPSQNSTPTLIRRISDNEVYDEHESKELCIRLVDTIFETYDVDKDGFISFDEYQRWIDANPSMLGFFNKIKEFANVHLGISPNTPEEEKEIIRGFIAEDDDIQPQTGQTFYILSAKWWKRWKQFVDLKVRLNLVSLGENDTASDKSSEKGSEKGSEEDKKVSEAKGKPKEDSNAGGKSAPGLSPVPTGRRTPADDSSRGDRGLRPEPIDNSDVIKESQSRPVLKPNLRENIDYVILSERIWVALSNWYGGGPPIPRQVISVGSAINESAQNIVEVYPLSLACETAKGERFVKHKRCQIVFSRAGTLAELKKKACGLLALSERDCRIWDLYKPKEPKLLEDEDLTAEDAQLVDEQTLLIEHRMPDGSWRGYAGTKAAKGDKQSKGKHRGSGGLCGLVNLGNTCFMNAALQSLSNSIPLVEYFLSDLYVREINRSNPLGFEGRIALQFGLIMKRMWSARPFDSLAPRAMKMTVGKFAPRFVGDQQQDAHEFMGVLLEGLHEGLNRVLEKPYTPLKDSDGRPDEEVAREFWENHTARNQSIIVDLFSFQMKSTLRWETCNRESVVFDTCSVLPLPLPKPKARFQAITVVFDDASRRPVKYSLAINQPRMKVYHLREALSELCGCDPERLHFADIYNHHVFNIFSTTDNVDTIRSTDVIYAYEIPPMKAMPKYQIPSSDFKMDAAFDLFDIASRKWLPSKVIDLEILDGDSPTSTSSSSPSLRAPSELPHEPLHPHFSSNQSHRSSPMNGHIAPISEEDSPYPETGVIETGAAVASATPADSPVRASQSPPVSAQSPVSATSSENGASSPTSSTPPPVSNGKRRSGSHKLTRRSSSQKSVDAKANASKEPRPPLDDHKSVDPPSNTAAPRVTERSPRHSHPTGMNSPRSIPGRSSQPISPSAGLLSHDPCPEEVDNDVDVDDDPTAPFLDKSTTSSQEEAPASSPVGGTDGSDDTPPSRRGSNSSKKRRNSRKRGSRKADPSEQEPLLPPIAQSPSPSPPPAGSPDDSMLPREVLSPLPRIDLPAASSPPVASAAAHVRHDDDPSASSPPPRRRVRRVKFHYDGWHSRWDEWVAEDSDRIAPHGTFSEVQYPKRPRFDDLDIDPSYVCVHAIHRRLREVDDHVLYRRIAELVGSPILLYVDPNNTTYSKLYELVWKKVRRYTTVPPRQDVFHKRSSNDPTSNLFPPFVLKRVKRSGQACSICSWLKSCLGCRIEFSDESVELLHNETIAIDWNEAFFLRLFHAEELVEIREHETVKEHWQIQHRSISFADCMRTYTALEKLDGDSSPYCSKCKKPHTATKKLELWSTPPILVIQLKRLVRGGRKYTTMVDFPLEGFDPGPWLVDRRRGGGGRGDSVANGEDQGRPQPTELYDLYSVVNHFGYSGAGHYVCYAKCSPKTAHELAPTASKKFTHLELALQRQTQQRELKEMQQSKSSPSGKGGDDGGGNGAKGDGDDGGEGGDAEADDSKEEEIQLTKNGGGANGVGGHESAGEDTASPKAARNGVGTPKPTAAPGGSASGGGTNGIGGGTAGATSSSSRQAKTSPRRSKSRQSADEKGNYDQVNSENKEENEELDLRNRPGVPQSLAEQGDGWYCFDDSRVTRVSEKEVITHAAYMLFYARRGLKLADVLPAHLREQLGTDLTSDQKKLLSSERDRSCLPEMCPFSCTIS